MDTDKIYNQLLEAYSEKNLTRITTKLIGLYQEKHYDALREVMVKVSEFTGIREEKIQRCFAYLLKLYHPDRTNYYISIIQENHCLGNYDKLLSLTHIFQVREMDFTNLRSATLDDDIDYHPEEVWDDSDPGFEYFDEEQMNLSHDIGEKPVVEQQHDDFLSAVKRKIYGSMEIELPVHLLEDLEEIEMAEYDISSLDGIRFCRYAVSMDLSGNIINDISEISECRQLEDLYLSHNQITIIDAISNLGDLVQLDLSYNQVDDLSPLYGLKNLEYVNLISNPVSMDQINKIKKRGILVVK